MKKFIFAVLCIAIVADAQQAQDQSNPNSQQSSKEAFVPSPQDKSSISSSTPSAMQNPQPNLYRSISTPSVSSPESQVPRKGRTPQAPIFQAISFPAPQAFQSVSLPASQAPIFQPISLASNPGPRPQVAVQTPVAAAPTIAAVPVEPEPFDPFPRYHYGYAVSDPATGNAHSATESRDGPAVKGQYSVVDPDGFLRVVSYIADDAGFRATVERRPVARAVVAPSPPRQVAVAA